MAEADCAADWRAYTGQAGDLLDLYVALAPCMIGYAEIGKALEAVCCLLNLTFLSAARMRRQAGSWQALNRLFTMPVDPDQYVPRDT